MREKRIFAVFLLVYLTFAVVFLTRLFHREHVPSVEPVTWSKSSSATVSVQRDEHAQALTSTAEKVHLPGDVPPVSPALKKLGETHLAHVAPQGQPSVREKRIQRTQSLQPAPPAPAKLQPIATKHKQLAPLPQNVLPEERDRAVVSAVLLRASGKIQRLYTNHVLREPDLRGKLTVRFLVDPTGRVVETQVVENELRDARLAAEVCETIRHLTFPPVQENAGPEMFRQTFLFQGV
ncbi:MAG: AgmX/PglI C-terminal domain-containing protein [Calditrichaeota bacterium]|nr:AgmX/PglI C-terminal domain-containing protein [Calditrichota bacterium]